MSKQPKLPKRAPRPGEGRPSKYKPEFCDMLLDHMSNGFSYESFAAVVRVHFDTLYEWEKVHAEFSESKKLGWSQNLLFWEQKGMDGLYNYTEKSGDSYSTTTFNTTNWIFQMKNRHAWRDKKDVEMNAKVNHKSELDEIPKERIIEFLREKQ